MASYFTQNNSCVWLGIAQRGSETPILWELVEILPLASALPGFHFVSPLHTVRGALHN